MDVRRMSRTRMSRGIVSLLLVLLPAASLQAEPSRAERRFAELSGTSGFQAYHPDLRFRQLGIEAYARGDHGEALRRFLRAARFADKPSQAMVAEAYWHGRGVEADRALGYVWMDLAAERGYPDFIQFRERYWAALTGAERERALAIGPAVFDEYADAVAQPRMAAWLLRGRSKAAGSRTGFVGSLVVQVMDGDAPGGVRTYNGRDYYAEEYWKPREYWRLQDEIWRAPVRERVDVGDPETVPPPEQ
ncbi:hypothetical protein [Pseudoxanthomonas sp. J35]|uniref:hypothetical protein n=1 Tax=Pseudoxanthomonas sp. J35 TaxID=935852 RepID=UPI0004BB9D58|nr:hypothetical protein [Pseudoxanthomonas sp. J35]